MSLHTPTKDSVDNLYHPPPNRTEIKPQDNNNTGVKSTAVCLASVIHSETPSVVVDGTDV